MGLRSTLHGSEVHLGGLSVLGFFRQVPFERGEDSFTYNDCLVEQNFLLVHRDAPVLMKWLDTFKEFPPPRPRGECQHRLGDGEDDADDLNGTLRAQRGEDEGRSVIHGT